MYLRQRRGAQCPNNSSSGALTCVSVVFESSSKQSIDGTVALKAERGPPWLLIYSGGWWRAVSADPDLLICLYFTLSYPSPEHEGTHQQWWGKQPPCSEQPALPWWRQRRWLNQNTTAGKKIHLTKEMHECKSPSPCCCRGADFLPSKHAGWVNRGGGVKTGGRGGEKSYVAKLSF